MKKKLFSIVGAGLLAVTFLTYVYASNNSKSNDVLFSENIEALADVETGINGKCMKEENSCIYVCPHCNTIYEASDYKGPSYDVHGVCANNDVVRRYSFAYCLVLK